MKMQDKQLPIIWYQAASCSGCIVSVLNALSPNIKNLIIEQVVPGKSLCLKFMPTVMSASGYMAYEVMLDTFKKGGYVLVVEGAIPEGAFGEVAGESMREAVLKLSRNAEVVIAVGSCACYGGIPKGKPNPTVAKGLFELSKEFEKPLICIPGCPTHPEWFTGTIAHLTLYGIPQLDALLRPKMFFGKLVHETCERRPYFEKGKFAKRFGEEGCLFELGCKGPFTHADCGLRSWNSGVNWCIQSGSPCIGCCEPEFPGKLAPFYVKSVIEQEKKP